MKELKEKLNKVISKQVEMVNKYGSNTLSTCDHYNWDKDIWNYRNSIIDKLIDLGFNVDSQMNWGVLDITITKELVINAKLTSKTFKYAMMAQVEQLM